MAERAREATKRKRRRQWRDYRTISGARPVKDFLDKLTDEEVAAVVAGMKDVAENGLPAAKHLRGDIYEVRADAPTRSFRLLFSAEGRFKRVLSLSAFSKKTQNARPGAGSSGRPAAGQAAAGCSQRARGPAQAKLTAVRPSRHSLDAIAWTIYHPAWLETSLPGSSTSERLEIQSSRLSWRKRKSGENSRGGSRRCGRRRLSLRR